MTKALLSPSGNDSSAWMHILICVTKTAINAFQLNNPVVLP